MNKTKIMFFSSSSCGPCSIAKKQMSNDIINELNIEIVNESDWNTFVIHEVKSVPTFIKINLENNKELNRKSGYKNIEELRSL